MWPLPKRSDIICKSFRARMLRFPGPVSSGRHGTRFAKGAGCTARMAAGPPAGWCCRTELGRALPLAAGVRELHQVWGTQCGDPSEADRPLRPAAARGGIDPELESRQLFGHLKLERHDRKLGEVDGLGVINWGSEFVGEHGICPPFLPTCRSSPLLHLAEVFTNLERRRR